jgi:hypothetical protein
MRQPRLVVFFRVHLEAETENGRKDMTEAKTKRSETVYKQAILRVLAGKSYDYERELIWDAGELLGLSRMNPVTGTESADLEPLRTILEELIHADYIALFFSHNDGSHEWCVTNKGRYWLRRNQHEQLLKHS